MNIDHILVIAIAIALLYCWVDARQELINRQRALRTQRENDAETLNKFGHGFGDWAVRQPRPQARDHDLERVPRYEDLWHCTACSCAEGTLPTHCPRVRVPPRVQDLIVKGVVDFVDGRWVGKRKPSSIVIWLGSVEDAAIDKLRRPWWAKVAAFLRGLRYPKQAHEKTP